MGEHFGVRGKHGVEGDGRLGVGIRDDDQRGREGGRYTPAAPVPSPDRFSPGVPLRKEVRFFCSYASKDSRLVTSMLDLLLPHLDASRAFEYRVWEFHKLLAGERWHERVQEEVATCDFGMLFVSPEFLASRYIRTDELPALLRKERIIPVGLKPVDFKLSDVQPLDQYQIFRLRTPRGVLRWFSELRGADRDAFALELFRQIEGRLA